jgi:hypothetical protein
MDFHTLDGVPSSGQLLLDNVTLVPEPSSAALAAFGFAGLMALIWRRSRCQRFGGPR